MTCMNPRSKVLHVDCEHYADAQNVRFILRVMVYELQA